MEKIEILSDQGSATSVTPSALRAFISQNGFKLLFWRILYVLLYRNFYSLLDKVRYSTLSRYRQTIKIQILNKRYLMKLNPRDRGLSTELCLYGIREPYTTNLMSTNIKEDDIIIDIGANIGYYALMEAKLAPEGSVYAIEPVSENFDYLKTNADLNECTNIKLFNCALSNRSGDDVISIPEHRNYAALSEGPNKGNVRKEKVVLSTLDRFVDEHVKRCPTWLRMDVEGHEHQILKGASRVLNEGTELKIAMELHPSRISESAYSEMLSTLEEQGFKATAFNDPDLYNIKHEQLSNKLRKRAHLTSYGFLGEGYDILRELKEKNIIFGISVLFTRESIKG